MKKIMIAGFWALLLIPNLLFPFVREAARQAPGKTGTWQSFPCFHRIHMRRIRLRSTAISMTMRHSGICS